MQAAFLSLVRSTCRTPAGWDRGRYGAGIVDADALLAAGLPATAPDQLPAAPAFDSLRRITAACSDLSPSLAPSSAAAVAGLAGRFGVDDAALPEVLRPYSSELVYLLGENPDLCGALLAPVPGPCLSLLTQHGHPAMPPISRHLSAALTGHQVISRNTLIPTP